MSTALSDLLSGAPAAVLVPGNADAVDQVSQRFLAFSDLFADAAHALSRVEVTWSGAAAEAFHAEFRLQPSAFKKATAAFSESGLALGSHALALDSGQQTAQQAIELFQAGLRAARSAMAGSGTPVLAGSAIVDGALVTRPEGSEQRQAAVEKLDRARSHVHDSGSRAAATLRAAVSGAPEWTSAWQHALNFAGAVPWDVNEERREWAAGGAVGSLDAIITAAAGPTAILTLPPLRRAMDDVERRYGIDARSGWHAAGSVVVPMMLTAGLTASTASSSRGVARVLAEESHPSMTPPLEVAPRNLPSILDDSSPRGWREVSPDTGHGQTRHQAPQTWPRRSQFFDDVDVMELTDRAPGGGVLQVNGNTRIVAHAPFDVGVDQISGLPTNVYTVFRRPDGTVASVFPGAIRWS